MEAGWFNRMDRKDHKDEISIRVGLDSGLCSMRSMRSLRLSSYPCYPCLPKARPARRRPGAGGRRQACNPRLNGLGIGTKASEFDRGTRKILGSSDICDHLSLSVLKKRGYLDKVPNPKRQIPRNQAEKDETLKA